MIPELDGRLSGFAIRVPTPTGSIVDLTVEAERATSVEEINAAFLEAATNGRSTASSPTARIRSSQATSSARPSRRSSTRADERERRHPGEGGRLVRQRVGLLEPPGGSCRQGDGPGARRWRSRCKRGSDRAAARATRSAALLRSSRAWWPAGTTRARAHCSSAGALGRGATGCSCSPRRRRCRCARA